VTELGKMMDPLTDRLFLITVIITIYIRFNQPPLYAVIILVARDLFLLCGYVYLKRNEKQMAVTMLGKTATATLMVAFGFMILGLGIGEIIFFCGLILYLLSAIEYVRSAIRIAFS
jgi:cardiolipin synthase